MEPAGPGVVRKVWEYRADGQIWRILPSATGFLLCEERDTAAKRVSFSCLLAKEGRVAWKGVTLPESWWVSMEAVAGELLLLHEYPVPTMPDHRKIFAVDIATGKLLWINEELTFSFSSGSSIFATRELFDRRAFFELDTASGEALREIDIDTIRDIQKTIPDGRKPCVALPMPASELPSCVLEMLGNAELQGVPDRLEYGPTTVISCYEGVTAPGTPRTLREHLFVTGQEGDALLFHDVLCEGLSLPVPESFFRLDAMIYYVKDKIRLCSVSLPGDDT